MGDVLFWPALALIACVAAVVFISVVRLRKLRHTIEHHMCLCSMVLRPVERLVFSPKER